MHKHKNTLVQRKQEFFSVFLSSRSLQSLYLVKEEEKKVVSDEEEEKKEK